MTTPGIKRLEQLDPYARLLPYGREIGNNEESVFVVTVFYGSSMVPVQQRWEYSYVVEWIFLYRLSACHVLPPDPLIHVNNRNNVCRNS